MKYLCLVYAAEEAVDALSESELGRLVAESVAFGEALEARGTCLAMEALESVRTATTLRQRDGRLLVTDGPFAETREQLAGFFLLEAAGLHEALHLAARIPRAVLGSIEVRPVRPIRETARAEALQRVQ